MTENEKLLKKENELLQKKVEQLEAEKELSFRTARFMYASKDMYGHFDKNLNLVNINKSGAAFFKKICGGNPIGKNVKALFKDPLSDYQVVEKYFKDCKGSDNVPLEITFGKYFYALHLLKVEQNIGIKIVDITSQVELRKKEQRLSEIINAIPELFYKSKIYPDGKKEVEYLSPQIIDVMGFTYEEYMKTLRAGKLPDFLHSDDKANVLKTVKDVEDSTKPVKFTYRYFHNTKKKYVWIEEKVFPQFDETGKRIANYGLTRDVTTEMEAQIALEKSEENYKSLIKHLPMGIAILDDDNTLLFANERAQKIFRIENLTAIKKKNIFKTLFNDDTYLHRFLDRKAELKQKGETPFLEMDITDSKGRKIIIESKITLTNYNKKEAIQIIFQDVTHRKQLEQEKLKLKIIKETNKVLENEIQERAAVEKQLLEAKNYTESIINSSLDMIITSDEKNNIIAFNAAAIKNFGYSAREIIGKKVNLLYKNSKETQAVGEALQKTGNFSGEIANIRKDKSVFTSYLSASYMYDNDGNIIGSMGISRNITQAQKDRKTIKEQAARLKSIIESSSHSFWTYSEKDGVTSFNQNYAKTIQALYGSSPKIGSHYNEINKLPKKEQAVIKAEWQKKYDKTFKGTNLRFETAGKNLEGKPIYRELFLTPIYNEDNTITEISGIGHDITKQKLAEQELRKSLKEKEILLQEVHHRVKNNLQIISSIFNLQAAYIKDKNILQILSESQNRIKSMAFIHETLYQNKDFSKLNFTAYIKTLSNNLLYSYDVTGSINLILNLEVVELGLDFAIPCGLIINELITNSIKYAFPKNKKGEITISLSKKEDNVQLIIADNGIGMSKNIDFKNTKSLGLQLVVALAEQINGKITLKSNEGTNFTIKFKA